MDAQRIELSVILACRNGASTLATQLEALARQEWDRPWEVLLSDNGSTDHSRGIAELFRDRLPSLRVIDSSQHPGAAYARNAAIRVAHSDRFAFCDVDDEVAPGWVAAMGEALMRHDFVSCRVDDQKLNPPWIKQLWGSTADNGPPVVLGFLPATGACSMGFTRRLFDALHGFDETFGRLEDIDFSWRAQLAGYPLHYAADAVVHYRYRQTLGGTFRQCFDDGRHEVALYRRYVGRGMTWRPWKQAAADWVGILRSAPGAIDRIGRGLWLKHFGMLSGRLSGCVAHRIFAP